jgi:sugar/nucleoside kinase (ribokinase family)
MKKILGIGNALVDVITFLDTDDVLAQFGFPRGSMQLIDAITAQQVEAATRDCKKHKASGGSAANTIHGLAKLGVETGFIGTVGLDETGKFFRDDMHQAGITPLLTESDTATGTSRALVSADGERTMATFLGAAVELSASRLTPALFRGYDHLHLEGYLVLNQALVETALALAGQQKMTISLDLASYNVVEANLAFLQRIVRQNIDIVFANEEEARAFTGFSDPHQALAAISAECDTAVVKIGDRGSLIRRGWKTYEVAPVPVKCLDTTGAGDLYAAGFLYGFAALLGPEKCGEAGSLLAGKVIEVPGAKISDATWEFIRTNL